MALIVMSFSMGKQRRTHQSVFLTFFMPTLLLLTIDIISRF